MAESVPKHPTKEGVTLIELLVSLTLITIAIALCSGFIQSGFTSSYEQELTEEWLTYVTRCSNKLNTLADGSPLLSIGTHTDPFPDISKPRDIKKVTLVTSVTNQTGLSAFSITILSKQNKSYQWTMFRYEK